MTPKPARALALVACVAVTVTGCASRLDRKVIVDSLGNENASANGTTGGTGGADAGSASASGTTGRTSSAGGTSTSGTSGSTGSTGTAGTGAGSSSTTGTTTSGTSGTGVQGQTKASGLPITVGFVGSITGLYGTVFKPVLDGIQIHIADINSRGGVNGHPVKLIVADDGADPANYQSQLRTMVEQDHVVAFVGNTDGATLSKAAIQYVESKSVPIIDGDDSNTLVGTSRMIFTFGAAGTQLNGAEFGVTRDLAGKGQKIGYISCQEVQQCSDYATTFNGFASRAGLQPVYAGRASLTAPDFTQNCLQARNAGVQVLFIRMDTNSVKRIARDCSRQGFKPKYAMATSLTDASFPSNPALEGAVVGSQSFPFINSNTPEERRFQTAMRRNRPADQITPGNAQGWIAASIFEKAAASIAPDATPSSALMLKGLYTFKGERLGGQTQALTFVPGKPPAHANKPCYFPMLLTGGKWTAPKGDAVSCL
jgi:branched-chain amino acid transport system substrate-binding protein